ncbi:MAG: hypothetical protein E7252_09515 [Lachnospira sp.]|nr:hypothetical protein [Lachnospira sp.]
MKGLLYKNFINGKSYIAIVAFYLVYVGSMISALSYEFANEKDIMKQIELLSETFPMMVACVFVACIIPMSMGTVLCTMDNKTKWTSYATALPGGYKLVVLEKYVVVMLSHILAIMASLITIFAIKNSFVLDIEGFKMDMDVFIMLTLVMVGISLVANSMFLPFITRDKGGFINVLFVVIIVVAAYAGFAYMALGDVSFFQQKNLIQKILMWVADNEKKLWAISIGLTLVGVVSQIVSYVITKKTYLKYT